MKWILIYWFVANNWASSTATAVFDDQQACKEAYALMQAAKSGPALYGLCVPTSAPSR